MEVIKKKICLENFVSRIPALIDTIGNDENHNGSWGKIPNTITIFGKDIQYETIMNLYYDILHMVKQATYYEYDEPYGKWLYKDYDWRDIVKYGFKVVYTTDVELITLNDRLIVGLLPYDMVYRFYDEITILFGPEYNGFNIIEEVNKIIGRQIVPTIYEGVYVPYMIYLLDIPEMIVELEALKVKSEKNCCEKKNYEEHGGDEFLGYLKSFKVEDFKTYKSDSKNKPTLNIPVLLTSKLIDMGQYRTYNVDEFDEEGNKIEQDKTLEKKSLVITTGESKLKTLRKRKRSVDINGNELPGIFNPETSTLESPYQIGYIKNVQLIGNDIYGDMIVSFIEKANFKEINSSYYDSLKELAGEGFYIDGTIDNPITGVNISTINSTIKYGDASTTFENAYHFCEDDATYREISLRNEMIKLLEKNYPNKLCLKQDYELKYELTYKEDDVENEYPDENGDIITPVIIKKETEIKSGTMYVGFDTPQAEIVYVIGGKLKKTSDGKTILDENSPFLLNADEYEEWDGSGIWYKETYPMKKLCVGEFFINDEKKADKLKYDIIDFESNEITYSYDGIDFSRKNYILCNDVRYKPETYQNYSTNDVIFKDEKMMGLNYPLKESYDVVIDRGMSAAYEKHLQLSELKTWEDLENYRNGMFLNK